MPYVATTRAARADRRHADRAHGIGRVAADKAGAMPACAAGGATGAGILESPMCRASSMMH
jgi:hypothetical protein